ncbi:MAG: hypothetical protein ABSH50_22045 [Bryobacteraceae bacterium]|jgi:hypothetical protein
MKHVSWVIYAAAILPMMAQQVSWVTMRESGEGSFSVEVPKGWKVTGGTFRFSPYEARMWMEMVSPDGATTIRLGDPLAPKTYAVPNALTARYGLTEGKWVTGKMVMNYLPGKAFADRYRQVKFGQACENMQVKQLKDEKPVFQAIPGTRQDSGDVIFTCTEKGRPMAGYVVAETLYVPVPGIGYVPKGDFWCVLGMASLLAPREQGIEAAKIMWHVMLSFSINKEWWSRFTAQAQRYTGASIQATQRYTAQAQANFQKQQAVQAQQVDDFNHVLLGQTATVDPLDGTKRDVATGPYSNYWINGQGLTISSTLSPGTSFRQLQVAR